MADHQTCSRLFDSRFRPANLRLGRFDPRLIDFMRLLAQLDARLCRTLCKLGQAELALQQLEVRGISTGRRQFNVT